MSIPAVLLALALLLGGGSPTIRARAGMPSGVRCLPQQHATGSDPLAVASSMDVLGVCLAAGMAVSTAAAAAAESAPPGLALVLRRAADLLALGADPAIAWSAGVAGIPDAQTDGLLRLARRSASSGAALADGVAELATQSRQDAAHAASAAAERAGVLIAGPLGLCFLPAFLCLGIVPVVAGLAGDILQSGLM
jgi:pilus assembly protein TadC